MKPKPLLSILITSHNQGALLERCVNSILVPLILNLKMLKHVSWRPLYWLPSKVWK